MHLVSRKNYIAKRLHVLNTVIQFEKSLMDVEDYFMSTHECTERVLQIRNFLRSPQMNCKNREIMTFSTKRIE